MRNTNEPQAEQNPPIISTESSPGWWQLDEYSQKVWLSHAEAIIPTLKRLFSPRIVTLYYHDPFHAGLTTFDESFQPQEHGLINVVREAK